MEHGRQHPAVPRSGPDERARAPRPADRRQPGDLRRARVRRGQHRGDRGRGQDLQAGRLRALRRQGEPVRDRRRPRDDPADVDDDRVADLRPAARPARAGGDRPVRLHRRPHRRLPRPAAAAPARRPARRHVRDRHARGRRPPDRPVGGRVPELQLPDRAGPDVRPHARRDGRPDRRVVGRGAQAQQGAGHHPGGEHGVERRLRAWRRTRAWSPGSANERRARGARCGRCCPRVAGPRRHRLQQATTSTR